MPFCTYIHYSEKLTGYYIGYTGFSPQERLAQHLKEHIGHTNKAKDWILVYSEYFNSKSEAMAREKQLKMWKSKERIRQLIERSETS